MTSRRTCATVVALALVLAVVAGCGGDDDGDGDEGSAPTPDTTARDVEDAPGPVEVTDDADLYAVPDPVPDGEHGTLLRYQELDLGPEGATTWRVMYLSESVAGDPIVVTGTVTIPDVEAPDGGRTVLTLAHGTTGIADECAPSRTGAAELGLVGPAVERGWVVAVTDYEGLGTPGRHPYLVGPSEGRGVLDIVRAAAELPDARTSETTLVGGYSQGGHAALWAGQLAEGWTPELDVVGTFAGAPATEVDLLLGAAPDLPVVGFAFLIVAGFAAAHPEADPALILTPEGLDRLGAVDDGCAGEVLASLRDLRGAEVIRAEGPSTEPWASLAVESNPGRERTDAPVLVIHSAQDEVVPVTLSELLVERMCGEGQVVERRVLPTAGGHGPAALPAYGQAFTWFAGLLDGADPMSTCA